MRLQSRTPKSMLTLGKSLDPAASAEIRRLGAHPRLKRMRECRAPMFPSDRKVARRCNHFVAIVARARLHVRVNHQVAQTRSIRLDKPLRKRERARSFVGR